MKIIPNIIKTKRHLCASGSILLPLAQKWGLVGVMAVAALSTFGVQSVSAASLSISVPGSLSLDVKPGEAAKDSTPAGFTVTSDAYWGYTLSVKSNNAEGALTNGSNKICSIGKGITTLNQFSNNTWGFRVSGEGVANPANYRQGPTTTLTDVAKTTGQKGANEIHDYSFVLAAKVDNTIPTGTYTGTFTFIATANVVNYTINYDNNEGADGPGKVISQSQEQFVKIAAKEPTKQDRVFLGWCDQEVSNNGTCDGTIYQPGNDYEITAANQETTLYAMWDWITMQNWDDCPKNLTINKQFTLVDSRDGKPYYVAKLADNNCWMTENLDLDIIAGREYTAIDTDLGYATKDDIPSGAKTDENGKYVWVPEKSTYTDGTWDGGNFKARSYDPGEYCWNAIIEPEDHSGTDWLNKYAISCNIRQSAPNYNLHYYLGNYYTYSAAVAQNDTSGKSKAGDVYQTSICPSGWKLPGISGEGSFADLFQHVKSKGSNVTSGINGNIHKDPYYIFYVGHYDGNHNNGRFAQTGYYLLNRVSTEQSTSGTAVVNTLVLYTSSTSPSPVGGMIRYQGATVRCVARK